MVPSLWVSNWPKFQCNLALFYAFSLFYYCILYNLPRVSFTKFSSLIVLSLDAQSCPTLCNTVDCSTPGSSVFGGSPGKNTGVGYHTLIQGIFQTQGLIPGLLHCTWILYCLRHQGSSRILEWVAYPYWLNICNCLFWKQFQ